jgi:colicin import membrane protein
MLRFIMKKFFFLIFAVLFISNTSLSAPMKGNGQGELFLSQKLVDEFTKYLDVSIRDYSALFLITDDHKEFRKLIYRDVKQSYKRYPGSGTIKEQIQKCESEFKQPCYLFSTNGLIVWNNGINPIKKKQSFLKRGSTKQEVVSKLKELGFIGISTTEKKVKSDEPKIVKKTDVEKRKEEELLAEEKRKEEERLAKEKLKEEERLAEERRKEEEINRKLSLFKETELEKNQKFINYTKEFVKLYPDEFDIVEIAKLFLSVDPILNNTMNNSEVENLEKLKKFTNESEKFKIYEKELLRIEKDKKIKLIDTNINDVNNNITKLKNYLADNITSFYSREIINLIEESEVILVKYETLEEIIEQSEKINNLLSKIYELEGNILTLEKLRDELKVNLVKFMSTEQSPKIISQIELIENSLNEIDPNNMSQIIRDTQSFLEKEILNYEKNLAEKKRKEEERLAEERRKEEERLAEERRKEEERLAEERRKEEERLAEERRKEEERLAEERRKEEDLKLQETYKKYKIDLNNEFQKDIIKLGLNNNFQFDDISFLRNDRIIKISNLRSNELKIGNIELKDFNKNIYNLIKNGFDDNLLNDLFKTKNWFSKLVISNISYNDNKGTKVDIQEFSIDDFELNGYEKYKDEIFNNSLKNDELNYISALLSLNIGNYSVKNLKYKSNLEEYSFDLTEFDNFSFTNTDKSTTVNYRSNDVKNNLSIFYKEASLDNFSLDQKEIVKLLNSINIENLDLFSSPGILLNSFSELENINIEDLIVEELNLKRKIFSLKNFEITDIEFEKPSNKDQKILSNLEFNIDDLEMVGMDKFYPEFSNYMKKLSYSKIALNTGGKWYWNVSDDEFGLDLNIGLTDAFSFNFTSEYSGLSSDFLNLNSDAMGTYFLTNFKINEGELSLQDKSLKNRLIRMFSLETNKSEAQVKSIAISNIRNYSATMRQSNLTREYEKSIINFIDGDDEIKFKLKPKTPVSIAEIAPYFQNGDADLLAEKLNLSVSN